MAYNDALTEKVRSALAHLPHVQEKKMFRGVAFMVNDKLCLSAGDNELMVRFDPAMHEEILQKPGTRSMMMKSKDYKGNAYVNEEVLTSKKALDYWINLALDFNPKAKAAKKRKSKSK